jgi:hypothetical protein
MSSVLTQSVQFKVNELFLSTSSGQNIDLTNIFVELNLFDNIFTPCRSGNILIEDSINLFEKLDISGNETLKINIEKMDDNPSGFIFEKKFKIYKVTNRNNKNLTTQTYILHFVNEDFIYSNQKKISQSYTGTYSNTVLKILTDHLKIPNAGVSRGASGIGTIFPTDTKKDFIIPNLTPFDAINWITKKSISNEYKIPDYVFYESAAGYNFVPVSFLWSLDTLFNINVIPKNLGKDVTNNENEFYGARDVKVLSQFSMIDNIKNGSYAGKFVGFDTFTKTQVVRRVNNAFELQSNAKHGNKYDNLTDSKTKDNKDFRDMYDSRIVSYPFALPRIQTAYIRENNPTASTVIDDTHNYVFQRKSYFTNMMQKRLQVTMPGNFGYNPGFIVNLDYPKFSTKEEEVLDDTLSGRYIITGVRHIIRYNRHETLLEICTDSSKL